jgi:hypothetical protein
MIGKAFLGAEIRMRLIQTDERGEGWEVRWDAAYAICFLPVEADRNERITRVAYAVADVMSKMSRPDPVQRFPRGTDDL